MNKLTVKGIGKIRQAPDWIVLKIKIIVLEDTYKYASQLGDRLTKDVKNIIEKTGFNKNDIKTSNFQIDKEYEYVTEEIDGKTRSKNVFVGYELTHSLKLEFDYDTLKLGEILDRLSVMEDSIEVSFDFTIKDKETLRNTLIENAVIDAKNKANIISKAAEVQLGNIIHIDYKVGDFYFLSPSRIDRNLEYSAALINEKNFVAEDIEENDMINVIWEIL